MLCFNTQIPKQSKQGYDSGWGQRRIILLAIILQSIGIRIFPLQGVFVGVVICFVLAPRCKISLKQLIYFIVFSVLFLLLSLQGMANYKGLAYLVLIVFSSFIFVKYLEFHWINVEFDLLVITWLMSLHGLISYFVYKILPSAFSTVALGGMEYKILGIFILSNSIPSRATGLCWEPGLLQYVANISLFLGLVYSWSRWKLAVSFLAVVVTFSTTGIFAFVPTIIYLLSLVRHSLKQWASIITSVLIVFVFSMTIFYENILEKFNSANTSGLIRLRDVQVGLELIKQKPFLGHGQFDEKYLVSNSDIWGIATEFFSKEFLIRAGEFGGGYTNGFFYIFAGYGIFIGVFIYWCFYNNRLIQGNLKEHLTFFLISIITFIAEPITNTSWFLFLAISGLYSRQRQGVIMSIHKKLMPQKRRADVPE